jgi:hypothetical protein
LMILETEIGLSTTEEGFSLPRINATFNTWSLRFSEFKGDMWISNDVEILSAIKHPQIE